MQEQKKHWHQRKKFEVYQKLDLQDQGQAYLMLLENKG